MLSANQITSMLQLQGSMNAKVNPNWLTAGYPFLRAVVIEGSEGMEHHGWKWWKAQQMDMPQLQMELVDIWHFALSHFLILAEGDTDKAGDILQVNAKASKLIRFDDNLIDSSQLDTLSKFELLIGLATAKRFSVPLFDGLLIDCKMDWAEMYRQYVGKNVLNLFRQDNGYKEGHYRKLWNNREDNEHLVEILNELDAAAPDFGSRVYDSLSARYAETA